MTARALTFGSVADAYERYRPGYPDELVDDVLAYARRPVATAGTHPWPTAMFAYYDEHGLPVGTRILETLLARL